MASFHIRDRYLQGSVWMAASECQRTVAMSETVLTATSSSLQLPIMSPPANKTAVLPEDRAQGRPL